jgi:hypothetical protein
VKKQKHTATWRIQLSMYMSIHLSCPSRPPLRGASLPCPRLTPSLIRVCLYSFVSGLCSPMHYTRLPLLLIVQSLPNVAFAPQQPLPGLNQRSVQPIQLPPFAFYIPNTNLSVNNPAALAIIVPLFICTSSVAIPQNTQRRCRTRKTHYPVNQATVVHRHDVRLVVMSFILHRLQPCRPSTCTSLIVTLTCHACLSWFPTELASSLFGAFFSYRVC